jgi:hypothetical protein
MIEQRIDASSFRDLKDQFKQLDRDVQKATKDGIKKSIGSLTSQMQGDIRGFVQDPPMSGMASANKLYGWRYPTVKPSLRLSAGPGKTVAQIVGAGASGYKRMFAITERAGSRSPGFSDRGKRMIRVLNERNALVKGTGGRYVFRSFLKYRPQLHDTVEGELNVLAARLNVRLKSGS